MNDFSNSLGAWALRYGVLFVVAVFVAVIIQFIRWLMEPTEPDLQAVREMPGVLSVEIERVFHVRTVVGPQVSESDREAIYEQERRIIRDFPSLSFDFDIVSEGEEQCRTKTNSN